jgi:hypothetical protein
VPFLVIVVLAIIAPRVVVALLWFLTRWFDGLFTTPLWPLLGFIFLPTTLIWYSIVQNWFGGAWTLWPVVGIVVALAVDLSPARGRMRRRRTD